MDPASSGLSFRSAGRRALRQRHICQRSAVGDARSGAPHGVRAGRLPAGNDMERRCRWRAPWCRGAPAGATAAIRFSWPVCNVKNPPG